MEHIFLGERQVAGFTLDVGRPSGCCGMGAPVDGGGGGGGLRVPAWLAGVGAGVGVSALAHYYGSPPWGTAVSGTLAAIGVWAATR